MLWSSAPLASVVAALGHEGAALSLPFVEHKDVARNGAGWGRSGIGGRAHVAVPESELDGVNNGHRCPRGRDPRQWSWTAKFSTSAVSSGTVQSRSHAMGQEGSGRHAALIPRQCGHWRSSECRRGWGVAAIRTSMSVSAQ